MKFVHAVAYCVVELEVLEGRRDGCKISPCRSTDCCDTLSQMCERASQEFEAGVIGDVGEAEGHSRWQVRIGEEGGA